MTGYIHSIYNGGMVDGLGIRSVVFLSGCPLRCLYCHNPDSWARASGEELSVDDVINEILKYTSFYRASGGGVTFTGGEPLLQGPFLIELLKACKFHGIHTAVDTSGYTRGEWALEAMRYTDHLMLDIKAFDRETYKKVTGVEIDRTLKMLKFSHEMNVPTWIRYVLVPGLTDDLQDMKNLAEYLRPFSNIEKVDVLPFHKQGEYKWEAIDTPYQLKDTPPPTAEMLKAAKSIFSAAL